MTPSETTPRTCASRASAAAENRRWLGGAFSGGRPWGPCGWGAALLLGALLRPGLGQAQPTRVAAATRPPAATYRYVAYTVFDHTDSDDNPPTRVAGVGGTLTLFPTGAYDKRLRITGPNGPRDFVQHGQYAVRGDSIRFAFTDAQGPDVQRGTCRYDARARRLTVVIAGYPPGNRGVYELVADAAPGPPPAPKRR
ncbi:hypothetical protein [Hymenobacter nivis]|uniref:Uncharacterized protein n=1 Tax=Hymenobacter nivis TaxID=1850093 RepID=A0A502GHM4_9BACT|nr:hypothetical protein [Hymenobacter nivis]TPG61797.1 hypothetical protein EAH73_20320 [Hymenobacter nivis]